MRSRPRERRKVFHMISIDFSPPTPDLLLGSLLIFALRATDVSLGTMRTLMILRGHRVKAAALGFVESSVWVLAISQVIAHLGSVWNILGYAGGFAAGTALGIWVESKVALGDIDLRIMSLSREASIARAIREQGFGVTELEGRGQSGPVYVVAAVVPRRAVQRLIRMARELDPKCFVTIDDVRWVSGGFAGIVK